MDADLTSTPRFLIARRWTSIFVHALTLVLLSPPPPSAAQAPEISEIYIEANRLAGEGDREAARDLYLQLLREDPDDLRYVDKFTSESFRLRDVEFAEAELESVASLHPEATAPLLGLSLIASKKKDPERAWSRIEEAIVKQSRHSQTYVRLITVKQALNQFESVPSILDSLLLVHPDDSAILHAKAYYSRLTKDFDTCVDTLEDIIAVDPTFLPAYQSLADIRHSTGLGGYPTDALEMGLLEAGALGDREAEVDFTNRLAEAYFELQDPRMDATWELAFVRAEEIGDVRQSDTICARLISTYSDPGEAPDYIYWSLEGARRLLARGDSLSVFRRLSGMGQRLEEIGEGLDAVGARRMAARYAPVSLGSRESLSNQTDLARLLLTLGDFEGAKALALEAKSQWQATPPSTARPRLQTIAREAKNDVTLAQIHYIDGDPDRAEQLLLSAASIDSSGIAALTVLESSALLARISRERRAYGEAQQHLSVVQEMIALTGGSALPAPYQDQQRLVELAEHESLALLREQQRFEELDSAIDHILDGSAGILPTGVRSTALLERARNSLEQTQDPEMGLDALLRAWLVLEREEPARRVSSITPRLLRNSEAPLEKLVQYFAQLALGQTPGWTATRALELVSSTDRHALEWAHFFETRRVQLAAERMMTNSSWHSLEPIPPALRKTVWEQVADRARTPRTGADSAIRELVSPMVSATQQALPEYASISWLFAPTELTTLEAFASDRRVRVVAVSEFESFVFIHVVDANGSRIAIGGAGDSQRMLEQLDDDIPTYLIGDGPIALLARTTLGLGSDLRRLPCASVLFLGNRTAAGSGSVAMAPSSRPDTGHLLPSCLVSFGIGPKLTSETASTPDAANAFGTVIERLSSEGWLPASSASQLQLVRSTESQWSRAESKEVTLTVAQLIHPPAAAAQPWNGGIFLGPKPYSKEDGLLRWSELSSRGSPRRLIVLEEPESGFSSQSLRPNGIGRSRLAAAVSASAAGCKELLYSDPVSGAIHQRWILAPPD